MSTSYGRMIDRQMSPSFWGALPDRFISDDQDKTIEQADDIITTKQGVKDGTDNE